MPPRYRVGVDTRIEALLDVLAPVRHGRRCAVFRWPTGVLPTEAELIELAGELVAELERTHLIVEHAEVDGE